MNLNQILRLARPLLYRRGKTQKWTLLVIGLLISYAFLQPHLQRHFGWNLPSLETNSRRTVPSSGTTIATDDGEQAILDAFAARKSNVIVQCSLNVIKVLRDDLEGDRHQKMLLRLPSADHTVLLAHNIDLAPRVPAKKGDTITVRGEYEFSDQGGVIHWTHHDPGGRHPAGWIEFQGERYE